ncbi:MAG: hypothetical protein R3F62_11940 [Planctomycetota bacterium]
MTPSMRFMVLACLASVGGVYAQAAPQIARFVYERGIEWGGDHAQVRIELARQADGSYRASVGGEKLPTLSDVAVSAGQLAELEGALDQLRSFPPLSFAGDGNHWYTRYEVQGVDAQGQAFSTRRDAYDPSSPAAMRRVNALEGIATRLAHSIAGAPAPHGPRIERFVYERGIEWGGLHPQLLLELQRQPDGSYRATLGGEDYAPLQDVVVSEAQLAELQSIAGRLSADSGLQFDANGAHGYTRYTLQTSAPGSGAPKPAGSLEQIMIRLADALSAAAAPAPAAPLSGGLAGGLGN